MYINAAEGGHAGAQWRLGDAYEHGDLDLLTDKDEAFKWYRQAAEGSSAGAQRRLGFAYEIGKLGRLERNCRRAQTRELLGSDQPDQNRGKLCAHGASPQGLRDSDEVFLGFVARAKKNKYLKQGASKKSVGNTMHRK